MIFPRSYLTIFLQATLLFAFLSCSNPTQKNTIKVRRETDHKPVVVFSGSSYFFAPEFDSTTVRAIGYCDCCSWNVYFIDSVNYIIEDYCIDGDTYTYGTYYQLYDTMVMKSGNKAVLKNYPDDFEESASTDPIFETIDCKSITTKCVIEQYKGNVVLAFVGENRYFGTRDTIEVAEKNGET